MLWFYLRNNYSTQYDSPLTSLNVLIKISNFLQNISFPEILDPSRLRHCHGKVAEYILSLLQGQFNSISVAVQNRDVENLETLDRQGNGTRRANAVFQQGGRRPEITSFRNPLFRSAVLPGKLIYAINIQIRRAGACAQTMPERVELPGRENRANKRVDPVDISSAKD